ncbi:MAG: hypothetical protein ACR2NP_00330, partial [Pirellulaceae bacterium]
MTRKSLIGMILVALLGLPSQVTAQEQLPPDKWGAPFYSGTRWSAPIESHQDKCNQCQNGECTGCNEVVCAATCNDDFTAYNSGRYGIASEERMAVLSGQHPFAPVQPLHHHLASSAEFSAADLPIMQQSPE